MSNLFRMYLDIINKGDFIEEITEYEFNSFNIQINILNSYDINQIITWKEIFLHNVEDYTYERKCPYNCTSEVDTIDHAYRKYAYLLELTLTKCK